MGERGDIKCQQEKKHQRKKEDKFSFFIFLKIYPVLG